MAPGWRVSSDTHVPSQARFLGEFPGGMELSHRFPSSQGPREAGRLAGRSPRYSCGQAQHTEGTSWMEGEQVQVDRPLLSGKMRRKVWGFLGAFLRKHHWFLRQLAFFSTGAVELGESSGPLRGHILRGKAEKEDIWNTARGHHGIGMSPSDQWGEHQVSRKHVVPGTQSSATKRSSDGLKSKPQTEAYPPRKTQPSHSYGNPRSRWSHRPEEGHGEGPKVGFCLNTFLALRTPSTLLERINQVSQVVGYKSHTQKSAACLYSNNEPSEKEIRKKFHLWSHQKNTILGNKPNWK